MNETIYAPSTGNLEGALAKSFVAGVDWPIDDAALAALLDMGLTPAQIAQYFRVTPADVMRRL